MTLRGKNAEALLVEIERRNAAQDATDLAKEKARAAKSGKELFDLEKLEALCDTSSEGRLAPHDHRRARFEYMYYVAYPSFMTIAEFAAFIEKTNKW